MQQLLATKNSSAITLVRVVLGIVIFAHGAQKLLGWFGGYGYSGTMGFFTGTIGLPYIIAFLVIMIEFFGAIALITGTLSRVAALGISAVMVGAVVTTHLQHGFFMNFGGQQAGEGFEYHLLVLAMAGAIMLAGGGAYSIDRALLLKKTTA